ncbi:hypothetical protein E3Z29_12125 [Pseudomonas sp. S150]|nr:hypothetical protein E3Z29_12125 [Pseudomonas sp. S150]
MTAVFLIQMKIPAITHESLGERACSRKRWASKSRCRLTHRPREQARSHRRVVFWLRIMRSSLNSIVTDRCNTAVVTNSHTVVLPPSIVYNRAVFYAILASDLLCRITVTVYSPQFSRLECP